MAAQPPPVPDLEALGGASDRNIARLRNLVQNVVEVCRDEETNTCELSRVGNDLVEELCVQLDRIEQATRLIAPMQATLQQTQATLQQTQATLREECLLNTARDRNVHAMMENSKLSHEDLPMTMMYNVDTTTEAARRRLNNVPEGFPRTGVQIDAMDGAACRSLLLALGKEVPHRRMTVEELRKLVSRAVGLSGFR